MARCARNSLLLPVPIAAASLYPRDPGQGIQCRTWIRVSVKSAATLRAILPHCRISRARPNRSCHTSGALVSLSACEQAKPAGALGDGKASRLSLPVPRCRACRTSLHGAVSLLLPPSAAESTGTKPLRAPLLGRQKAEPCEVPPSLASSGRLECRHLDGG